jgi:hypothetical protein
VTIENLTLSYPDFQAGAVINPEEFDQNNNEIVTKINELVDSENADVAALAAHLAGTDHDARYYTEAESDAKYATKADVQNLVLGQIPDDFITSVLAAHLAENAKHLDKIVDVSNGKTYKMGILNGLLYYKEVV